MVKPRNADSLVQAKPRKTVGRPPLHAGEKWEATTLRLPVSMKTLIEKEAQEEERPLNSQIVFILKKHLKQKHGDHILGGSGEDSNGR